MNQSDILSAQTSTATKEQKASNAFRVAVIMLVAALAVEAFYLFLAFQMENWQMYALAGVIAFFCLLNIIALPVIRQGAPEAGGWLIISGMFLVFPGAGALIANVGFIFAGALIILTVLVASQMLSGRQARAAIIGSLIASALTASFDYIGLEYRLFVPEIQVFIPVITVVILLAMLAFLFIQYQAVINASLQLKITIWMGATLVVVSVILIAYAAITSREAAIRFAESDALSEAAAQASFLRAESEVPLDTARAIAHALTSIPNSGISVSFTRDQVNAMLRQIMLENPSFIGVYTLWEPNAFDGRDSFFRNRPGHDATGRFIPYWERTAEGGVALTPLVDYEIPGPGDWYLIPKRTRQESALAPLIYPVQGVDTLMAAFTVPIVHQGQFYGIAGVDAPITFVQEVVDSINLYDGAARAVVLTTSGALIGVRNQPELANQPASQILPDFAELQPQLLAGEPFISPSSDGQFVRVFAPIELGFTGANWFFSLIIPLNKITEAATLLVLQEILIGAVLTIAALALLWFLSAQIVRPVRSLTDTAVAISQGNLNITARVDAKDETGVLADAFNLMISQLQSLFATFEERVADQTYGLQLAAEVGRAVSEVRDLDIMLKDAAELIRSRFNLYYVQVYLVDTSKTNLLLQAGTGDVGAQLLERKHRLRLDTGSINGRAAVEKRSIVVADTASSATFRPNPLLPETRSEMAIPLLLGDRLIGVLNLQSSQPNALNTETLISFEALAGQIAVAVQNASLLEQTEQARAEVEAQARRLARTGWQDYLDAIHRPEQTGFVYEKNEILPLGNEHNLDESPGALAAPISLTGQQLGALVVEMEEDRQTPQTIELVNIVARQVAQQVENLRLLESAERYRMEAEESARRMTREGWEEYFKDKTDQAVSYLYDSKEVKPQDTASTHAPETALNIPIKVRNESIGELAILGAAAADPETLELVNIVSERLGEHIESLRLLEETQRDQLELNRRAQQLAAVSKISTASSRELDIQKMLAAVVRLTQREFNLYHAHVFTYNENARHLEIVACGWKEGDEHEGTHGTTVIPLMQEQSLVARAARTRQPVLVGDVRSDEGWLPNPMLPDTASELAVPLMIGDEVLGVLDVQSDRLNAFSDEDVNIQMTLAAQVATALQNARSFSRAQRQAERETLLNAISQKIQSATSVEAVLQIAARELGHALKAPRTIAQLSMKDNN